MSKEMDAAQLLMCSDLEFLDHLILTQPKSVGVRINLSVEANIPSSSSTTRINRDMPMTFQELRDVVAARKDKVS